VLACWLPVALKGRAGRPGDGIAGLHLPSLNSGFVQFFMKKLVRALVALAVSVLGVVIVPPAHAAPSSYMPKTGALFSDPN
jgi:hypothetical protein